MSTQTDTIRKALENIGKEAEDIGTPVCNCGAPATGIGLAVNNALAALSELEAQPSAPTVERVMEVVKDWYLAEDPKMGHLRARLTKLLTNP